MPTEMQELLIIPTVAKAEICDIVDELDYRKILFPYLLISLH